MSKGKLISINTRIPRVKEEKKKHSNRRLIMYIVCFFIAIFFILYFEFSLSRISTIKVEGNYLLSDKEVVLLSEVTRNDSYLQVSRRQVEQNIRKSSKIKDVEVEKRFPNKIIIHVTEFAVVGYLVEDNQRKPLTEDGKIIRERMVENTPVQGILLYGFEQGEILQELAGELSKLPASIHHSISEIHYTPSESNLYRIQLYTNEGFRIIASIRGFATSMLAYPSIIQRLEETGIIDIEAGGPFFTPFQ